MSFELERRIKTSVKFAKAHTRGVIDDGEFSEDVQVRDLRRFGGGFCVLPATDGGRFSQRLSQKRVDDPLKLWLPESGFHTLGYVRWMSENKLACAPASLQGKGE